VHTVCYVYFPHTLPYIWGSDCQIHDSCSLLTLFYVPDRECADIPDDLNFEKIIENAVSTTLPAIPTTPFMPPTWPKKFGPVDYTHNLMLGYAVLSTLWAVTSFLVIGKCWGGSEQGQLNRGQLGHMLKTQIQGVEKDQACSNHNEMRGTYSCLAKNLHVKLPCDWPMSRWEHHIKISVRDINWVEMYWSVSHDGMLHIIPPAYTVALPITKVVLWSRPARNSSCHRQKGKVKVELSLCLSTEGAWRYVLHMLCPSTGTNLSEWWALCCSCSTPWCAVLLDWVVVWTILTPLLRL